MSRTLPLTFICLLGIFWLVASATPAQSIPGGSVATIRHVAVLGKHNNDIELEITATARIIPQTQLLTGPDRLVIDFPGAVPGTQLHPLELDRGQVSSVRVGLFASKPPVTRVVVDLKAAQPYQVFPSGNTVLVKIGSANPTATNASGMSVIVNSRVPVNPPAAAVPAAPGIPAGSVASADEGAVIATVVSGNPQVRPLASASAQPAPRAPQNLSGVSFQKGLLRVKVQNATLAQVLFDVQRQTGAEISVPAGAAQEQVVADLGPAAPKEVLAALLNGSHYNFIILGTEGNAALGRVILTPKSGGAEEAISPPPPDPAASMSAPVPNPEPEPEAVMPSPDMPPDQNGPPPAEPQPN